MANVYGHELNIVLLGKTGHGKSATGNTIMRFTRPQDKFKASSDLDSVTAKCISKAASIEGRRIVVVDTPGTMDTQNKAASLKELAAAIDYASGGFSAFVIVLKFGTRMTTEEKQAIQQLHVLFGELLMQYLIVVMTHGNSWEMAKEEYMGKYNTFHDYIKGQKSLESLRDLPPHRWILIENSDKSMRDHYSNVIIQAVDKVVEINGGKRYTNKYFDEAVRMQKQKLDEKARQERLSREMEEDGGCFPADAMVILNDNREIKMEDLKIGQEVLTGINGELKLFSEVFMFGHAKRNAISVFHCIETEDRVLTLSPNHHVFIKESELITTKAAKNVNIGDSLLLFNKDGNCPCTGLVIRISTTEKRGLFAPFTMSGSIVVNGIVASCYIDMVPPHIAHPLMWPVRQLYKISPSTLSAINKKSDDGIPQWIRWCIDNVLS